MKKQVSGFFVVQVGAKVRVVLFTKCESTVRFFVVK